jgi:hypothetical protein
MYPKDKSNQLNLFGPSIEFHDHSYDPINRVYFSSLDEVDRRILRELPDDILSFLVRRRNDHADRFWKRYRNKEYGKIIGRSPEFVEHYKPIPR